MLLPGSPSHCSCSSLGCYRDGFSEVENWVEAGKLGQQTSSLWKSPEVFLSAPQQPAALGFPANPANRCLLLGAQTLQETACVLVSAASRPEPHSCLHSHHTASVLRGSRPAWCCQLSAHKHLVVVVSPGYTGQLPQGSSSSKPHARCGPLPCSLLRGQWVSICGPVSSLVGGLL